jgi:4-amino-4-deoxy-L-arabinose transferase-like glycosyltransferase
MMRKEAVEGAAARPPVTGADCTVILPAPDRRDPRSRNPDMILSRSRRAACAIEAQRCAAHSPTVSTPASDRPGLLPGLSPSRAFALLLLVVALVVGWRLATIAAYDHGLFVDEAQYIDWAREPAFGYYSKPPVLAWSIALMTRVCGEQPLCVRGGAVLMYSAAVVFLFLAGLRLFDARIGLVGALLYLLSPGLALTSLFITTDAPLALFTSASLLFAARALQDQRWLDWTALGLSFGLGLMSKYSFALFIGGFLFYLVITPERRRLLVGAHLWTALAIAGALFLPNLIWNAHNSFATFSHTAEISGLEKPTFSLAKLGEFLGGQLLVFGPLTLAALFAVPWLRGTVLQTEGGRMLGAIALVPLAAFTVLAFLSRTLLNWAFVALAPAILLAAAALVRGNYRRWMVWSFGVSLLMIVLGAHLPTWARLTGVDLKRGQDPYSRTMGWPTLGQVVSEVWRTQPGTRILTDDRWVMAELLYYVQPPPRDALMWNPGGRIDDHYRLTRDAGRHRGESFVFVTSRDASSLAGYFEATTLLRDVHIPTHKDSTMVYRIYRLDGFAGY